MQFDQPRAMTRMDWVLLASLYGTQFLAVSFFVVALVAILRSESASLDTISMIFMLGLIGPIKLLWAPFVDRLRISSLGHFRGWLMLMQVVTAASLIAISQLSLSHQFGVIYGFCILISLATATQDIAIDGLACSIVPRDQRPFANGLQIAGGLIGNMLGGGLILILFPSFGWSGCTLILAICTALPLVFLVFYQELETVRSVKPQGQLYRRLFTFWQGPEKSKWLLLIVFLPLAGGMAYGILTPMLIDFGWALSEIGLALNVYGSFAGLLAALAGGWLASQINRQTALRLGTMFQLVGVLGIGLVFFSTGNAISASLGIVLYFFAYNPLHTIMATLMMDQTEADSAATDYSLQFSLFQFVAIGAMIISSILAARFGYGSALLAACSIGVLAIALSFFVLLGPIIDKKEVARV